MKWRYQSRNILGNVHDATRWINEHHPEWDVVSFGPFGENGTPGSVTCIVYRELIVDEVPIFAKVTRTVAPPVTFDEEEPDDE